MTLRKAMAAAGILALSALILPGCASNGSTKGAEVSTANPRKSHVEKDLVKGKTTQSDLVQLLGSPNIVTKNGKGDEVWTYTRQAYDTHTGGFAGGAIIVSTNKVPAATENFDLVLTFNKKEIVQDYSIVSSQF